MERLLPVVLLFAVALAPAAAAAADEGQTPVRDYHLVIKNHRWNHDTVVIPADTKVRFLLENQDDTPEEFDSRDLNVEKVLMGHSKGQVYIGPLKAGRYKFQGEYHPTHAQGVVIAK
ncbi:MAG TPA: cupredoxin domain-containing protein [Gallionellaceae bacterium]|nr:cupredoxin domain-containing protein [Gallionellaceae bacterium]